MRVIKVPSSADTVYLRNYPFMAVALANVCFEDEQQEVVALGVCVVGTLGYHESLIETPLSRHKWFPTSNQFSS